MYQLYRYTYLLMVLCENSFRQLDMKVNFDQRVLLLQALKQQQQKLFVTSLCLFHLQSYVFMLDI